MAITQSQAPIVGDDPCIHLDGDECITAPLENEDLFSGAFSLLLDLQTDEPVENVVLGARTRAGPGLALSANAGDVPGLFRFEAADTEGRRFVATAQASESAGKRIFCAFDPPNNEWHIAEVQPWAPGDLLVVNHEQADGPKISEPLGDPVVLGGCNEQGTPTAGFRGRLAHFALFEDLLDPSRIADFRAASASRAVGDMPSGQMGELTEEGRGLFLDDYERLVSWTDQPHLSRAETRDVSVIAYRWLQDVHPLLPGLADHYGAQLSLPDLNPMRAYRKAVTDLEPSFHYSSDRWEGKWLPPSAFLDEPTFWLPEAKRDVSWAALVKFIRNKLGGGHYDPEDRKRWQEELNALATETKVSGEDWLDVRMMALARALRLAAESCGYVTRAQFGL